MDRLRANTHSFANLATMQPDAIVERLRARLQFADHPHLTQLANAILDLPLSCLSIYYTEVWLTFNEAKVPVHLPGLGDIPSSLYDQFPVKSFPELEEFLRYFGGMADGFLPPGACFLDSKDAMMVTRKGSGMPWGLVDGWEGSLALYHGSTGDHIVLHPDGYAGKWYHEIGWSGEEETPFQKLDQSFVELVEHFSEYLALPLDSPKRKTSPFYY